MRLSSHEIAGTRPSWRYVLLLSTALSVGGCGAGKALNPFQEHPEGEGTVLEVQNRHWADMTISVRRGGRVARLGLVTTNRSRRFPIPADVGAAGMSVTFLADPVGSGAVYESPTVALAEGEAYTWTLAVSLEHSTLVRR